MPEYIPPDPSRASVPLCESPLLEARLARGTWTDEEKALLRGFAENGYVVIDLEWPEFDRVAKDIIDDLAPRYPEGDRRIEEAWYFNTDVRAVATHERVLDTLRLLYGREPIPFQTLNFDRATEQHAHSDTLHFHAVPARYMCGVWVAFEDIGADCGPLFVVPGSHKMPPVDMFDLGLPSEEGEYQRYEDLIDMVVDSNGFERKELHMQKGQAVIWAANLLHGGSPVRDPKSTRHSQASHYYFEDCMYYFPMKSEPFLGELTMREVIDIRRWKFVPHVYRGQEVRLSDYRYVLGYPRPLPDGIQDVERSAETSNEERAPVLKRRLARAEESLATLQDEHAKLQEAWRTVQADNLEKERFIRERESEFATKVARRVTKTWRAIRGRGQPS